MTSYNNSNKYKGYNGHSSKNNKGGYKPNYSKNGNVKSNYNGASYVGAPYNFVSVFDDSVIGIDEQQMVIHDTISDDLYTGEISYTLTAKTPIIIDDGKGHFHRDSRNRLSIPGSTMRGLIRNNVQILGMSSFEQDIDDYRLMYRNVAAGVEKKAYNDILGAKPVSISPGAKPVGVLTNVSAGYISKNREGYVIYKTTVDKLNDNLNKMNYYVLSEREVAKDFKKGKDKTSFPYFVNHPEVAQHILDSGFKKEENRGRVQYKGYVNKNYIPGFYHVSYEIHNVKNVSKVGDPGVFSKDGYLVCTGNMNMKKALYIVPAIDETKKTIPIPDKDVKAFRIDFESKKNTLKRYKNVDFFDLPKEGERKPVFYIELDNRLYFGYTPRLRLFYKYTVKDGMRKDTTVSFDYAKSMFGCIGDKEGYKSKVSFADAIIDENCGDSVETKVVLASPKPTSYLDYLEQDYDGKNTYNTNGFKLRGVKQYWLHETIVSGNSNQNNDNVGSIIRPLKEGTTFNGKVRFQNLTRGELGLLLWSIKLNDNSWMNVGKAKSYGYGAVSISDVNLNLFNTKIAYQFGIEGIINLNPMVKEDISPFILAYKEEINKKLPDGKKIDEIKRIKEFFIMKDSMRIPNNSDTKYMELGDYRNRKPLKTVMNTVKKS